MARPPRILLVDDDESLLRNLQQNLANEPYAVEIATDGVQAVEMVRREPPQLLVLDAVMPRMDGLEVCRAVKAMSADAFIPVILLTARDDMDYKVHALQNGVDDFLTKPFDLNELKARIGSMLRIKAVQDRTLARTELLESLNAIDSGTGLPNARAGMDQLEAEFQRAKRYTDPLSLMVVELGGTVPADLWKSCAQVVQECLRETDFLYRHDEQRFLVILPQTHVSGSLPVAERIWRAGSKWLARRPQGNAIRLAIGVACYPNRQLATAEHLIDRAMGALSQAREQDTDRIGLHQQIDYLYNPSKASNSAQET